MKRILPILLILFLLTLRPVNASHIMGAEVFYRHLGGLKYELTYKIYRDCRGVPLKAPTAEMYRITGTSSSKKTLSFTPVSIKDVSNYCKKLSNPCNPPNTIISSSEPGTEEHLYRDTVDFNGQDSAFKKYCTILIGVGQCCRNGTITTGGSNNDF